MVWKVKRERKVCGEGKMGEEGERVCGLVG